MPNPQQPMPPQAQEALEQMPQQGAPQGPPQQEGQQMDPQLQKQMETYSTALLRLIHGKETRDKIYQMLKSGPPEQTIPRAAMVVNKQFEDKLRKEGQKVPLEVALAGNAVLTSEFIEIIIAGGFNGVTEISEQQAQIILKETLQAYIADGLKNRTIDPIELQQKVEPLLSDEQRAAGKQIAQQKGIPSQPGQRAAMEMYADRRVQQAMSKQKPKQQGPPAGALQQMSKGGM